jgi:hypothetical protein
MQKNSSAKMKKYFSATLAVLLAVTCLSAIAKEQNFLDVNSLNIPFFENKGQFGKGILFGVSTFGGNVFLTDNHELIYFLNHKETAQTVVFKERFSHSGSPEINGGNIAATRVSYFLGSNKRAWKTAVSVFGCINMGEICEGVTAKLKAHGGNIEKLFYIQPHTEVNDISLSFDGIISVAYGPAGELVVNTNVGEVSFTKPVAYQISTTGNRENVEIVYAIRGNGYGFKVGEYDNSRELIIDPLLASTFIGSNGYDDDYGPSMQTDNDGNIYLCGYTSSATFPYINGYDPSYNGGKDIFIAKFNSDLSVLLASTFFGGSGNEYEATMAFDNQKQNIYIGGYTSSTDFPCTDNAYDTTSNGGMDAFVFKIDKNLQTLVSSGYFGGSANEGQQWPKLDITITASGKVCITGLTCSDDFPVTAGVSHDCTYAGGSIGGDAFVVVFDQNLSELLASTYLGGSANEWRMSIAADNQENIFVCGETESNDFEFTANAYDPYFNGGSDIFICKYNIGLSVLLESTSYGKNNYEEPLDIKLDSGGNVFIVGYTKSTNFPTTAGAFDNSFSGGDRDGYIAKFNNQLTQLLASTFVGGNHRDDCTSITIDDDGSVYVAGNTSSTNYPCSPSCFDSVFDGGTEYGDAVISVFDNSLTQLKASTYLDGAADDRGLDILLDSENNIYIAGYSKSPNFPFTPGAYDTINSGSSGDCFISRFTPDLKGNIVGIDPGNDYPDKNDEGFYCYPNPDGTETTICFIVKTASVVKLDIYNNNGDSVATLVNTRLSPGLHSVRFSAVGLANGVYFGKLSMANKNSILKMIVEK